MPPAPPKAPPPGSSIPPKPQSIPPSQTLYVRGLPSAHINKDDLRTALYMLFSTYGPVLDVVALKTMKMRGQAHIVYRDIQTATQAMRALDGFEFLGCEIVSAHAIICKQGIYLSTKTDTKAQKVMYAKSRSNIIAKLDGTAKMPTSAANQAAEMTDLQQSIFNAPVPGSAAAATTAATPAAPAGLPSRPQNTAASAETPETRGQKRQREEDDEDEDSDVAMEEDSDDD